MALQTENIIIRGDRKKIKASQTGYFLVDSIV